MESGEVAHGHAGEAGMSVMMYLYPELVDPSKGIDEGPKQKDLFPKIIKHSRYSTKTESGVIGLSNNSNESKGRGACPAFRRSDRAFFAGSMGHSSFLVHSKRSLRSM